MTTVTAASNRTPQFPNLITASISQIDKRIFLIAVAIIGTCYLLYKVSQRKHEIKPFTLSQGQIELAKRDFYYSLQDQVAPNVAQLFLEQNMPHFVNDLTLAFNNYENFWNLFSKAYNPDFFASQDVEMAFENSTQGLDFPRPESRFLGQLKLLSFFVKYHEMRGNFGEVREKFSEIRMSHFESEVQRVVSKRELKFSESQLDDVERRVQRSLAERKVVKNLFYTEGTPENDLRRQFHTLCDLAKEKLDLNLIPQISPWLVKDQDQRLIKDKSKRKVFVELKPLQITLFSSSLMTMAYIASTLALKELEKSQNPFTLLRSNTLLQKAFLASAVAYHRLRGDFVPDLGLCHISTNQNEPKGWVAKPPLEQNLDHERAFYQAGTPQNTAREQFNQFCDYVKAKLPLNRMPEYAPWFATDLKGKIFDAVPGPLPYKSINIRGI